MNNRLSSLCRGFVWLLALVLTTVMLPGFSLAEPEIIKNVDPAQPARTLQLEALWRVGGEDEEFFFGMIVDCLTDTEGNVYLLDNQLCNVEVFTAQGEHLRTLSGEGDGPGEVRIPQGLVTLPDGTLGILELFPGKIVKLNHEGEPRGTMTLGGNGDPQTGFVAALRAEIRNGTILVAAQHSTLTDDGQDRTQYLARISEEGEELARYREASMSLNFNNPHFVERDLLPAFLLASAVGPDGQVYVARDRNQYAIEVYTPEGELVRVIERVFENRKRDERDMHRMNALVDAWIQGFPGEMPRDLEAYEPTISEMFVAEDGTLWVQHSRSGHDLPPGILLSFDTFDTGGKYLQEVHFAAEGDPAYDGLKFLPGDRALLIKGYVLARWASRGAQNATFDEEEETGAMEVVYCKMNPAP